MKNILLLSCLLISLISCFSAAAENKVIAQPWQLKTQSGEGISLNQFKGKAIVLHFWATWCPYCKKLQPKLVDLHNQYQKDNVAFIAISFNEDEGALPQDEIYDRGYKFITAINGDDVAESYGVIGTPTTFFINAKGEIIFKSTSSDVNDPRLELAMKEIIK